VTDIFVRKQLLQRARLSLQSFETKILQMLTGAEIGFSLAVRHTYANDTSKDALFSYLSDKV